jgi:hypothetical protein
LSGTDGRRSIDAGETLVASPLHLRSVRVSLPERAARELQLWVHAITPDGGSQPTPVTVEVDAAGEARPILVASGGVHEVLMPGEGLPATLTISLQPGTATS